MLYQIMDATVTAGGRTILSHIDFYIKEKEKIAVVGRNGAGKSTLLKLLAGEIEPDRDDKRAAHLSQQAVTKSRNITIGMLSQADSSNQGKTIDEIILEACPDREDFSRRRFEYEVEYDRLFTGFGFEKSQKSRMLKSFSGGEQTKILLIRLLLQKPDLLLLDEPTNHLDMQTIEWLEGYIASYGKAVVVVSHDRAFLDAIATRVYELESGVLHSYTGNYTQYRQQKLKKLQAQTKAYEKQQEEIAHLNELIERFKNKPNKAAFARSRKTMLSRMALVEKPQDDEAHIFTDAIEPKHPSGKWVYEAKDLKIGYDKVLLQELSLRIRRGQKIAVIGDNGAGKSTFLKTIAGLVEPISGESRLGNNLLVGYFEQQSALLEGDETVLEHFEKLFPAYTQKQLRSTLAEYLFRGAAASQRISSLSGGEKSRLILAELLTSGPNLMILDEPTNHMDIPAKETLESAFKLYKGTLIFASHDRYFIKQVADAVLIFEKDRALFYPFGYEHYIQKKELANQQDLPGLIKAQDQAMIASLKAVPKPKRNEARQLTTEEAYVDWKLRLASEPLEAAKQEVQRLFDELMTAVWGQTEAEIKSYNDIKTAYNNACECWTQECIKWYDIYQMNQ